MSHSDAHDHHSHGGAAHGSVKEYGPSLYGVSGLQFGKDSSLYICQAKARRISVLKNGESLETVIENVRPNDLVVTNNNQLYFTETSTQRVYHVNLNDKIKVLRIVDTGRRHSTRDC